MPQQDAVQAMISALQQIMQSGGSTPQSLVKSFDQMVADEFPRAGWTGDKAVGSLRESLAKAMGIADGTSISGTTALQLENLDSTMTEVLVTEAWMKLWNALPKEPSMNALFEYNRKNTYGSFRGTAGFAEGGAPNGSESTYTRTTETIRYLGEKGGVTHQLAVAGNHGGVALDPTAEANRNATIRLLAKVERAVFRGDTLILDESSRTVNYDGILKRMRTQRAANVVNMHGAPLAFSDLEEQAYNLFTNGKLLSFAKLKGFATGFVASDLGSLLRTSERSTLSGTAKADLIPGTPFGGWNSQFGFVPIEASQFLDEVEGDAPLTVADPNAPAAPGSVSGGSPSGSGTDMPASTQYYFAAAFNTKGESVTVASSGVTYTAGQQAVITVANVAAAIGYRIYRSTTNDATTARWIKTLPQGTLTFTDSNAVFPGAGTYLLFNADKQDIAIPQLSPLIKWPLAITSTTVEFLLLLYHSLVVKAPERVVIFENIGRA